MKFNTIESIASKRTHRVWVINRVFSSFQDKQHPTYIYNREKFVSDMIMYLDI